MTDDLVTRAKTLSAMINLGERIAWGQDTAMIDELAARIEADAATIARLEGERNEWRKRYHETHGLFADADEALTAAEAKVAALVEALEEIASYDTGATAGLAYTARAAIAAAKGGK